VRHDSGPYPRLAGELAATIRRLNRIETVVGR
jgi:hypothetical protein